MNRTTIDEQQLRGEEQEKQGERPGKRGARKARDERAGSLREALRGLDVARLRDVGRNLGTQLAEQAGKRPYIALGAAAGIGFAAGSLFGSRLGQALLAVGIGYVARNLVDGDIGVERLQENIEKLAHERMKG